jgi:hypothetical protein
MREDGRIVGGEELQEKVHNRGMEEAPENGKKSSHSAHANGMNECIYCLCATGEFISDSTRRCNLVTNKFERTWNLLICG